MIFMLEFWIKLNIYSRLKQKRKIKIKLQHLSLIPLKEQIYLFLNIFLKNPTVLGLRLASNLRELFIKQNLIINFILPHALYEFKFYSQIKVAILTY